MLYPLFSGSSGNATLVSDGERHLLVDMGVSRTRLSRALSAYGLTPGDLSAVLVTHEHGDHVGGLPTLLRAFPMPVFASHGTAHALRKLDFDTELLNTFAAGDSFHAGGVPIQSFPTLHDTPESVGYCLQLGSVRAAVATDMGEASPAVLDALCGADVLLLEANHDVDRVRLSRYPMRLKQRILGPLGHLSNDACAKLAIDCVKTGASRIILGHLSRENNTPDDALSAVSDALAQEGLRFAVHLEVASA